MYVILIYTTITEQYKLHITVVVTVINQTAYVSYTGNHTSQEERKQQKRMIIYDKGRE